MLDHVFTDAIGALRDAFENALLERQAVEEQFKMDVLLGDMTWVTSYGLPGEGTPPRFQVDITLDWPTWSQTAYRLWYIGEGLPEVPRIEISIVLRAQQLATQPDLRAFYASLPETSPKIGAEALERRAPSVEATYDIDLNDPAYAIEVCYEGSYEFDEDALADGSLLDTHFSALGGWISATLVKVGDQQWDFLPRHDESI